MAAPRLVVGLGNPGADYAGTRHNCGFWLVERIADRLDAAFRREARFHGLVAQSRDHELWLLEPQTFMNRSGLAVRALSQFYRIEPDRILVLHDELDLPPGALRLKFGGGLGGHNGLKDIAAHLGTQDFWRLRIGIGHPGERDEVIGYVLRAPRAEERSMIDAALDLAISGLPLLLRGEHAAAMQKFNTRPGVGSSGLQGANDP